MNCVNINDLPQMMRPNEQGFFGPYGGAVDHPVLAAEMEKIKAAFYDIIQDDEFKNEMQRLQETYVGRPSPIYHAKNLSNLVPNGAQIYLKREDLNHTGAHKINNVIGQALLADRKSVV